MESFEAKQRAAIEYLSKNYPNTSAHGQKYVGGSSDSLWVIPEASYSRIGMKQSKFQFVVYETCKFENVAFTGSQFRSVAFRRTDLIGNSFACCEFYDVEIDGLQCSPFTANNFSLSNFDSCKLKNFKLLSSGMLGSLFHNCAFENVTIASSTLEGTSFVNCLLRNCDVSHVNVEFMRLHKTELNDVCFPFYQFPYVIGSADYITNDHESIALCVGDKTVSMAEYRSQIENLILYYMDKQDYFPMCNLCLAKGDVSSAKQHLLDGISFALKDSDFRMIRYYCQLALQHNILDESVRQRILSDIDSFLERKNIPETQLNYYMTHIGNIHTMLRSGGSEYVSLHFDIKTNVNRNDGEGLQYVNTLITELNRVLSQTSDLPGFQVTVTNYSPYQIAIDVLSVVGSVASISSMIWMVIDKVKEKQVKSQLIQVDNDAYQRCIDARIDVLRERLLRIREQYSKRSFNKHIMEVTQQLKTDLQELYSKDVMIFRIKNDTNNGKNSLD